MIHYFLDPVLRVSTIGSMLMCLVSGLVGVLLFVRKRLLLGEVLSHATYPGIVVGVFLSFFLQTPIGSGIGIVVLIGAAIAAWGALILLELIERRGSLSSDSALCFILASFFGLGILGSSVVQGIHPIWHRYIESFLYGQVATMSEQFIVVYLILLAFVALLLYLFYRPIEAVYFDRGFSQSIGVRIKLIDRLTSLLVVIAIVTGIRSVGVVLLSGMLIAPVVAARHLSSRLSAIFILSGFFSIVSGFFGNYFSIELSSILNHSFQSMIFLPTGPMILLVAVAICMSILLFAPRKGLFSRAIRIIRFHHRSALENLLKRFWKRGEKRFWKREEIPCFGVLSKVFLYISIKQLVFEGWMEKGKGSSYRLSDPGAKRAAHIVRLHRLWEVYLVDCLGKKVEKVHANAEEMEHILTPELEKELTELLNNPKRDPHRQPIPSVRGEV